MKKLITGLLILFFGIQLHAQIKTNKSGTMLGQPYFKIKCKSEEGFVNYDILKLVFTSGDEESACVFRLVETPHDDKSLQTQTYTYKSDKVKANQINLRKKVLSGSDGLFIDKDGFLKIHIAADADWPNASLIYVEVCEDGEHVRFYDAKRKAQMNDAGSLDHYKLTDIKYLTLVDTPEGKRITFKDKPEGDKSMWKLFRVQ
ncbi:hypothetical protein [Marinifilum sp. D737]|uniref:hypothetical protein n=1 Tax=Marinifilum sp. D737 TaxID=2969628 RepID=UPI002275FC31|nr:hypothetical protein [Marinifilum sp. D737]MCY1635480.1 hypothetical protein [Marinifilum sp. D737]